MNLVEWNGFLEEHISSVLPIQLLGQEARQEGKAFRFLAQTTRSYLALFRTAGWFTVWTSMAVVLAMSAVIEYGGWSVIAGTLSLGSLVAFYSFVTQLFDPLSGAAELYSRAQRTFASIRQLQGVCALRPSVTDPPVCIPFPSRDWGLEFVAVEFGYERQARTLHISSLWIAAGEKVAVVGENGAGKSTLARLVTRLYDVKSGLVKIGGVDVREMGLKICDVASATCREIQSCSRHRSRRICVSLDQEHPTSSCAKQSNWLTSRIWSRHFQMVSINASDLTPASCQEVNGSAWRLHERFSRNRAS